MEDAIVTLESTYVSVVRVLTTEGNEASDNTRMDHYEHPANKIGLKDYAKELAFLPDFTEEFNTTIDYDSPKVTDRRLSTDWKERLIASLKTHEHIMIASGNALPLPAYGVVCDIDTQGHAPIKQRARRVPLRYLSKLYELLRALQRAGLIVFSDSPWASPIVMKKNGQDIRLCIDYKMVNAITAIMQYAMPLVDNLLTDLECYLWFCSLDAASGFGAIMMTLRARKVPAFVCALGHFEWLRMPFGLKNAPMIYQRMIDNALWGFLKHKPRNVVQPATKAPSKPNSKQTAKPRWRLTQSYNWSISPVADMFTTGELDESSLVPVFGRRSFVDDICFGGEDFDSCLATLDRLLTRFAQCRTSISFTKSIFCQPKVDFLSHEISPEGITADSKKLGAITAFSRQTSKRGMQSFFGALNYYSRFIQDFAVYGAALYQLKKEDFGPRGDLSVAQRAFEAQQTKVAEAPILKHFDRIKEVHVILFANEWALSTTLM
ncbi:hypothetical protein PC121_g17508 [Phytophthora cactorum]|nr:hypothetical protein PC121_g17508 [Phytophthora cactorum]